MCFQVVLAEDESLRLSLTLSGVLPCPMLWLMSASTTLVPGLRLSVVPYPSSFRMGLEPLSEAPLSALQPPAPSFLVVLAVAACLRVLLDLSMVLPWPSVRFQGHLLCTSSCQQVVFCAWGILLLVRLRPLPDDSLGALGLPAHLLWPSLRPRVCESSSLSNWFFPFWGPTPISCLFLSWRPRQSRSLIPSLASSWWCPCPLMRWALLTLSGYVLSVPSAFSLRRSRWSIPFSLSPLSRNVFADGFRHL